MDTKMLQKIKDNRQKIINFRKNLLPKDVGDKKYEVMVCSSTGCHASQSQKVYENFCEQTKDFSEIQISKTGCFGLCSMGPIVIVYPQATFYTKVQPQDVAQIVQEHLLGDKPVEKLLFKSGDNVCLTKNDIEFYKNQKFVARKNSEYIDPENLQDYIAVDGYFALDKALKLSGAEIIKIISQSGLKGRGGAGFLTGKKWELAKQNHGEQKFVICNADEGDPGAFMDRSILEANPFAVLEAMTIAGYAIGANHGIVYVRAEYPLACERVQNAIDLAKKYGLLGKNILQSNFDFDITIKKGAGAFVCGEETALIKSCQGMRGEPNKKPPYPAASGYFGQPTIINNVETLANVPQIILNGAEWFAAIGNQNTTGTKVFALTGKVKHSGLVELPMGTTIRQIVYDIGGGTGGKEFKAVQMGGPSGACIPKQYLDTPIDFDSLKSLGAMMGSGGMIVMDQDTCMVNIAKFFLEFSVGESCGKCIPCRLGNKKMLDILNKICDGNGTMDDLDQLQALAEYIKENSLCGLGQSSPNPVLSTLKYFHDEYVAHINGKCPAGVCPNLTHYKIDKNKCVGCSLCARLCPVNAIFGQIKSPYEINQQICIKCGKCYQGCRFHAIDRE